MAIKIGMETVGLLMLFSSIVAGQQQTYDQYHGKECTARICLESKGYIKFSPESKHKIRSIYTDQYVFTSIVLHIKNIQVPQFQSTPWLRIYVQKLKLVKKYEITNNTEVILTFKEANEVIIESLSSQQTEFLIEYYVGCQVLEGSNLSFKKEKQFYGNIKQILQQLAEIKTIQTCWLIFPITREQQALYHIKNMMKANGKPIIETRIRNIETKQVYTFFKNVTIFSGSVINVVNIVSDQLIMEVNSNEEINVASSQESEKSINYDNKHTFSTAILVDLKCQNKLACTQAEFKFNAYGLQEKDLNCIDRERKCLFNIGREQHDCSPNYTNPQIAIQAISSEALVSTSCPAFNYISENILEERSKAPSERDSSKPLQNSKRRSCTAFKQYCAAKQCKKVAGIRKRCMPACLFSRFAICDRSKGKFFTGK